MENAEGGRFESTTDRFKGRGSFEVRYWKVEGVVIEVVYWWW